MKSGRITERLDHVFISFFSPDEAISFTFFISFSSTNGPFFNDRGNLLPPLYDIHVCPFAVPRLYALRHAPWGTLRPSSGASSLATAQRVIDWVHGNAPDMRSLPYPSVSSRLA